jgi:hypothetical protein
VSLAALQFSAKELPMDCYIVRIYKREGEGAKGKIAGVVEKVRTNEQKGFSSSDELIALLGDDPVKKRSSRKEARNGR